MESLIILLLRYVYRCRTGRSIKTYAISNEDRTNRYIRISWHEAFIHIVWTGMIGLIIIAITRLIGTA